MQKIQFPASPHHHPCIVKPRQIPSQLVSAAPSPRPAHHDGANPNTAFCPALLRPCIIAPVTAISSDRILLQTDVTTSYSGRAPTT